MIRKLKNRKVRKLAIASGTERGGRDAGAPASDGQRSCRGWEGLRDVTNTHLPFDRNIDQAIKRLDSMVRLRIALQRVWSPNTMITAVHQRHRHNSLRGKAFQSIPPKVDRRLMARLVKSGSHRGRASMLRCIDAISCEFILDHEELEKKASSRTFECAIYMRGISLRMKFTLSCEHRFCALCLNDWFK